MITEKTYQKNLSIMLGLLRQRQYAALETCILGEIKMSLRQEEMEEK